MITEIINFTIGYVGVFFLYLWILTIKEELSDDI